MKKEDFRIVFMGTPDFAVGSLKVLIENNFNVAGVVTNPDKPAGRGQKIKESAVKKYAAANNLNILQPPKLKNESFINQLKKLSPNIQVVVAFKILPPEVFNIPSHGTFNLHASLLPDYRGAAPINHTIINGETETGVTTFFLDDKVDTGKIIDQRKVDIKPDDTAGTLHDKLMKKGSQLVVDTVEKILSGNYSLLNQEELIKSNQTIKKAPKIFKEDCRINWNESVEKIYNFIRGLSPYPASWTEITSNGKKQGVKIFEAVPVYQPPSQPTGTIHTDEKNYLQVACKDGFIDIKTLQLSGKRKMKVDEFLVGFREIKKYRFE